MESIYYLGLTFRRYFLVAWSKSQFGYIFWWKVLLGKVLLHIWMKVLLSIIWRSLVWQLVESTVLSEVLFQRSKRGDNYFAKYTEEINAKNNGICIYWVEIFWILSIFVIISSIFIYPHPYSCSSIQTLTNPSPIIILSHKHKQWQIVQQLANTTWSQTWIRHKRMLISMPLLIFSLGHQSAMLC